MFAGYVIIPSSNHILPRKLHFFYIVGRNQRSVRVWHAAGLCVPIYFLSEPGFSGLAASHLYVFSQDRQQCLSAPKTFIA